MATTTGRLPKMWNEDTIRKSQQTTFGGYNHVKGAGDGDIWDMTNMTGDFYPLLASRQPRYHLTTLTKPNGFYAHDGLFWVDGTSLYKDGEKVGTVSDGEKQFASLGAYIVILPDKLVYNRNTGEMKSLEESWTGSVKIQDGTYAEEEAKANTIYAQGANWASRFNVGDAVTIEGCTTHEANNYTPIIREIDGDSLRFYENTFVINEGGDTESRVTIKRTMPDMDFLIENENRLWGCKEDTIYASKLGDPFNWNVFDGVATDSFAVGVGSPGDFTAAFSYLGYPVFFKEEYIYKVYGSKPSNFQVMSSASLGVEKGSHKSLAIAGEILFYLSRVGIVAYSGGIPQSVSQSFGTQRFKNGVAGSNGPKYFVSMQDGEGAWHLFVYDTAQKLWHREDDTRAADWGWNRELYYMTADGQIWVTGNIRDVPEGTTQEGLVESVAEFADFVEASPNKKGTSKIQVRMELEEGATVDIHIQYDSDGEWHPVQSMTTTKKKSFYCAVIPRRSDHFRLRFTGTGQWYLYSLVRENYTGSEHR